MAAKLSLVKPVQANAPPRPLGKHGMALWRSVTREYGIEDCGGVELLCQACQALDRAEECGAAIAHDGVVVRFKGLSKDHPLIKHELAARAFVVRTLQRLGLDVEALKPEGRPGGGGVGIHWSDLDDK